MRSSFAHILIVGPMARQGPLVGFRPLERHDPYRWIVEEATKRTGSARAAMAAVALGAASVFLSQWDPDDHWATPDKPVVIVVDQLDDDDWVDAPPHWGTLPSGQEWASFG